VEGGADVPNDLKARLAELIESAATEHGFELVLLEAGGSRREPCVRVYLDCPGGITIDRITESNRWIKALLDDVEELKGGYTLEVSSPGIERPLSKLADFVRFTGSDAKLSLSPGVDGHKSVTGPILGVEGSDVLVAASAGTVRVPYASITRANLRVTIDLFKEGTGDDGI
jgi:ribosome maturation factor RimP